jgi:predicted permease
MVGSRLLRALARILLPRRDREFVLGDLEELYALRAERSGPWRAGLRSIRDLLGSAISRRTARGRPTGGPSPARPEAALLDDLIQDVRAALRSLVREKGFTAVTVLTLALGIGSTAAVFGMVNQLVLRPLPGVPDPGGAAYLQFRTREDSRSIQGRGIATLDFDALREAATLAEGIGGYGNATFLVSTGEGRPLSVWANAVYGDYFEVLGGRPSEGRLLTAEDNRFGADPLVAVISEDLRARLFGPDASAAARTILVNDRAVRVLGVTSGGFQGAERASGLEMEMWVPYPALAALTASTEERLLDRNSVMHRNLVVRLPADVPTATAEARLDSILARIGDASPEHREYLAGLRPTLFPGLTTPPMWRATTQRTLTILGGIVALVLLVACANVANLLLFRNVMGRGSAAVRRALGASSARIARGHLVQSFVLAGLGSLAGLGVAWLISLAFRGESLIRMPAFEELAIDKRVMAFAATASLLTTLLFGAFPAVLAGRFDLGSALREAARANTGRSAHFRTVVAAAQIALSLALLIGAVMLTRTVSNLYAVETGMTEEGVAVLPIELPERYGDEEEQAARAATISALEALPGVARVAVTAYSPHGPRLIGRIAVLEESDDALRDADMIPITAGWFELLGVTSEAGAELAVREDAWRRGQVVLTASLARRLFERADAAVGRTVRAGLRGREEARVVAVTSDLRSAQSPEEPMDAFFVPFEASPLRRTTVIVRAAPLDAAMLGEIRGAVERALPGAPVADPTPLTARVEAIHSESRLFSRLLGLLSVFAVALAAVGLYGIIAFAVAGRRREFGVRIALGARAWGIARLVGRYAGSIVLVGSGCGVVGGYALSRILESRLFGLDPVDPASYGVAVALFAVTATVACWLPTRRAIRVDPVAVLKSE